MDAFGLYTKSEVITIIKLDVFIFYFLFLSFIYLPELRRIPHIVECASVARYHPLVGLCIAVGTLTSKQLNSHSFIISPHMDGANLFTLVSNIKVSPHQKWIHVWRWWHQTLLNFQAHNKRVFEQLGNSWTQWYMPFWFSPSRKLRSWFQSGAVLFLHWSIQI